MRRPLSGHVGAKPVHRRPVQRSKMDRPAVGSSKRHARELLQLRIGNSSEVLGTHRARREGVLDALHEVRIHIFENGVQVRAVEPDEPIADQRRDPEPALLVKGESIGENPSPREKTVSRRPRLDPGRIGKRLTRRPNVSTT